MDEFLHCSHPIKSLDLFRFKVESVWSNLLGKVDVVKQQREVVYFNSHNSAKKRGLAILPTKFGVCYDPTSMNQVIFKV